MSGLSSVGSSLASSTSGTSSPSSSTSLLSQVGQSLLTTGQAPNATPSNATSPTSTTSSYQAEFLTLQQQDTAELLYASFLSPTAGLENADEVLGQAAQLLGTPGSLASAQATSTASTSGSTSSSASSGSSSASSTGSSTSSSSASPSSSVSSLLGFPSVSSILSGSDAAAQQTLTAYGNAPAGSSIIDYQA